MYFASVFSVILKELPRLVAGLLLTVFLVSGASRAQERSAVSPPGSYTPNPNDFRGSDNEKIRSAIAAAEKSGGVVRVTARTPDVLSDRTFWLLDEAILLPGGTTLLLENCRLKLSDVCRDNFIRSANCGIGIRQIKRLRGIHIIGHGEVILEGADRPRATGDSAKTLGDRTYGTDAGKAGESQTGDWRNIGILLAEVEDFSIRNLSLKDYHAWGISLEHCRSGTIADLRFDADNGREIDGKFQRFLNQDGLDLRKGCRDITIENISGRSGDDLIALTGIRKEGSMAGTLDSTMVGGSAPRGDDDDMRHIVIRNVRGYCAGGHHIIRFLNTSGIGMHDILVDGVIDTSPEGIQSKALIRVGDSNPAWGGVTPLGDTGRFVFQNLNSRAANTVLVSGSLCDSRIDNVIIHPPGVEVITPASGEENMRNVSVGGVVKLAVEKAE